MFKRLVRGSTSQLFKIVIALLALTTAMVIVFGNPNTLKTSLKQSNIFEAAVENVIQESQKESKSSKDDVPLEDPRVQTAIKNVFSGEFLETQSDNVIDGIYTWLDGKSDTPTFNLDLDDAKTKLANSIGDAAVAHVKSLKACSAQQLVKLETSSANLFSLTCRPPGINLKSERAKLVDEITNSDAFLKDTSLSADDLPKDENGQTIFDKLEAARSSYQWSKRLPWILGGVALAFMAAVILLHDDRRRGIMVVSRGFLIAGAILLVGVLISNFIAGRNAFIKVDPGNEVQASTLLFARALINALNRVLLTFGLIYAGFGAAGLLALHFTKTKTPEKPEAPVDQPDKIESKPKNKAA